MSVRFLPALAFLAFPGALSAELRDYCPDRPGLATPSCTIDKGHVSLEVGLADWTLDRTRTERDESLAFADILLRYGLTDSSEIQLGWTGFGHDRAFDRVSRQRTIRSGTGDVSIALRQNLSNPDGSGFSAALMPFATLPVGRQPLGAGDWSTGLKAPLSYELGELLSLGFTPEIDAAVDEDGKGRHLAYGAVTGVSAKLSKAVTTTIEYQLTRDRDPAGKATQQLAGLSLGWQPSENVQLDIGANAGLRHAPDVQFYVGVSRRF